MNTKVNNTNNTKVNNNAGKEVNKMRKGTRSKIELSKNNLGKGIATWKMYELFSRNGEVEAANKTKAIINKIAGIHAQMSYAQQQAIKNDIKNIETVILRGVEIDCNKSLKTGKYYIKANTTVKAGQESVLTREVGLQDVVMGDDKMCLRRPGTYDLLSVNVGGTYDNGSLEQKAAIKQFIKNGVLVKFNKKTGLATVITTNKDIDSVNLKKHEAVYRYGYLGITASGLKSHSMYAAAIEKRESYNKKAIRKDNRAELLDTALGKGFVTTFMDKDGEWKKIEKKKAFKLMGRVLLGAPGSKEMGSINNYVVFDNIAENAGYKNAQNKKINCENTQDGAVFISVEKVMEQHGFSNYSKHQVLHHCVQARGANNALKGASEILERRDVAFLAKYLQNQATVEYAVVGGDKFYSDFKEVNKKRVLVKSAIEKIEEAGRKEELFENIDMIADTNAIKIYEHENEFKLVWMKHAYTSESSLNMVVNMMLTAQDSKKGIELIKKLTKKAIAKKFGAFGFDIELDDNANIISSAYNVESRKNNEGQFSSFLFKNSPKTMMYLLPSVLRGMISSTLEGVSNLMNTLKAEMDSLYTVVQSDPSPLFGHRILKANEVFCPCFNHVDNVSGVRHPISGPKAITTFKTIDIDTIIDRISKLKIEGNEQQAGAVKSFLTRYYQSVKTFAIIPASHYLMEKHDGMDFDIDAMQFILEPEAVEILQHVEEVGTKIEESDAEKVDRYIVTPEEAKILEFKASGDPSFLDMRNAFDDSKEDYTPANEREAADNDEDLDDTFSKKIDQKDTVVKNEDKVTLDFDGMLDLAFAFFDSTVDPIGIIATGFYNNFLIHSFLTSKNVDDASKKKVAQVFAKHYGCGGEKKYTTQLERHTNEEGFTEILLSKKKCTSIIFEYASCDGSLESTIQFLADCLDANRYIAETSIDAAKNDYKIIDMFNHMDVIMAIGSDKAYTVKLMDKPGKFVKTVNKLAEAQGRDYDEHNRFGVFMLDYSSDKAGRGIINIDDIENINEFYANKEEILEAFELKNGFSKSRPAVGITDIIAKLKKELVNYTNNLIVYAAKELEMYVSNYNLEAVEARKAIIKRCEETIFNNEFFDAKKVTKSLLSTITDVVKKVETTDDFEEMNSKLYLKEQAVKIFKNTIIAAFKNDKIPMTDAEIGLCFLGTIVDMNQKALQNGKVGSTHSTALNVFDKYILAFFNEEGIDVNAYEEVICAVLGKKNVSLDKYVGQEVEFYEGEAKIGRTTLKAKNKHLNFTGVIVKDEHCFYVKAARELVSEDYSLGMYIPMKKKPNSTGAFDLTTEFSRRELSLMRLDNVKFVQDKKMDIKTTKGIEKNVRIKSSLVGTGVDKAGNVGTYHACELVMGISLFNLLRGEKNGNFTSFYNRIEETVDDNDNTQLKERSGFVQYTSEYLTETLTALAERTKEDVVDVEPEETTAVSENEDDSFAPVPGAIPFNAIDATTDTNVTTEPEYAPIETSFVAGDEFGCTATPIPVAEKEEDQANINVDDNVLLGDFQF